MNGQIDLITLISLIVAVVAILKLRSVLGSRTDEDDARVRLQPLVGLGRADIGHIPAD